MKKRWRISTLAAGAAMAVAPGASTGAAFANDFSVSPSVFLQFSFGADWNVGLGVDVRGSYLFESSSCFEDASQSGVGVFAQGVFLFRGGGFLVGAGLHGGAQPRRTGTSWDIELGWAWRSENLGKAAGHGVQLGVDLSLLPWSGAARFTLIDGGDGWVPEGHLAGGLRVPGVFGSDGSFCVEGRPQRDGDGFAMGRLIARPKKGKHLVARGDTLRAAVGRAWAESARAEAASVPAFVALARDLGKAGAPAALVRRALGAADDEVRHARVCAGIAGRALGCVMAAEMPPLREAEEHTRLALLQRLGAESMRDGVIGEGAAALEIAEGARRVRDIRMRKALRTMARDEAAHAALAADVVAWAVREGGQPVKDAVVAAVKAAEVALAGDGERDGAEVESPEAVARWRAGGRLLRSEQKTLYGFALDKAKTRWSL